mmetsp:Transcript_5354/g.9276  ORF Transcript_5354/g.9276 Transcript_5354/m.9276 type:complete len:200 (+) Transcript_5354:242-841(+)
MVRMINKQSARPRTLGHFLGFYTHVVSFDRLDPPLAQLLVQRALVHIQREPFLHGHPFRIGDLGLLDLDGLFSRPAGAHEEEVTLLRHARTMIFSEADHRNELRRDARFLRHLPHHRRRDGLRLVHQSCWSLPEAGPRGRTHFLQHHQNLVPMIEHERPHPNLMRSVCGNRGCLLLRQPLRQHHIARLRVVELEARLDS